MFCNNWNDGPDPNTPDLLCFYLNIFLDLYHSLKQEDFQKRKNSISNYFNKFENLILKKSKLTKDQLNVIKNKLNEFEDFKESEKSTSIIYFILQVLRVIPFWSKVELDKNIRLIYDLKKKK